jgi:ABC-2 type transport system ATP-binding protein
MRVGEFLKFRAKLFGIARGRRREAIELAMQRCALGDVRRRPIHQLSKGYRQRVGFAAAILHEPPVLILDEPTVGLDPSQIVEMRRLIRELAPDRTIVLSTHILPEVEATCDHIVMMARGRIRAQGTIESLKADAAKSMSYRVEYRSTGAVDSLKRILGVIDVRETRLPDGWTRVLISSGSGVGDMREPIAAALSREAATIRELTREIPTLEHVFVKMIADAEAESGNEGQGDSPKGGQR